MEKIKSIPSIKNILTPGKNAEDEILYGSGRTPDITGQHESSYYGDRKNEPRSYNRNNDFIPSQPIDSEEYNKVETGEIEQPRHKQATSNRGATQDETTRGHHKDNHSPYTKHSVDPRLGDRSGDPQRPGKAQPQRYSDSSSYESEKPASSTHDVVEDATQTSPGQLRTRIGSTIDPSLDNGKPRESAYEHTTGGGGAYKADKVHGRESRVASVTLPDNVRYKDPEADESYGLDYDNKLPSGIPYKPLGVDTGYARREPEVATTKSEAAKAVHGTTTGRHGDAGRSEAAPTSTRATDRGSVAGVNVPGAGYEADRIHHGADVPAYTTTPTAAQRYQVEVPRGNDYGRVVNDPRYGLPMSAAGISASEAEALRRSQAYATQPAATDHAYKAQPPGQDGGYGTKPLGRGEEYTTKPAPKSGKSRRSSLLEFLHLDKVKPKKKASKVDEQHIANKQRQSYTDLSGEAPIGTAAAGGYTGRQSTVPGTMGSQSASSDLAYRARLPSSTADAPAFTGSFVAANGEPIKVIPKDRHEGYGTTERAIFDRDKVVPGTSGGVAHEKVPGAGRAANEAYGAGTADRVTNVGAADETPISEPYERRNSDYDMRWSSHKGNAAGEALYDQVSPHSSATDGYKGTQTAHAANRDRGETAGRTTNRAKGPRASDAAYGGKETQARNAAYDYGTNEPEAPDAVYDYGGNEAQGNNDVYRYGGNERQAYENEAQPRETARDGKWERTTNGLSHHNTKTSERGGRTVLHKDPPSHRMASAVGGE